MTVNYTDDDFLSVCSSIIVQITKEIISGGRPFENRFWNLISINPLPDQTNIDLITDKLT